jgi:UDPglucose 6-dehydrogenase
MRISIVGTGHVGLVTAACLAHLGHEVLGVDEDAEKVAAIAEGRPPFHEPGLGDLLADGLGTGRLRVSTDLEGAARFGEVVFISVGTPTLPTGEANLAQVERVARRIARQIGGYTVVAEKSTVPVETGEWIRRTIVQTAPSHAEFDVVSNPEFQREGRAVEDTLHPHRIVVGTSSERAADRMRELYRPILDATGCPFIVTDLPTAELIKHASNAFLATKVSFINKVADICERAGADVEVIAAAMGLDPRIGPRFLRAGIGYGGACLPKDVKAFRFKAEEMGVAFDLLAEVDRINEDRRSRFLERIRGLVGNLEDKRVAIWGLAFKADTDDLRNAPAIDIAQRLTAAGATVAVYDPAAMPAAKPLLPEARFCQDPYEAVEGAECLAICTEWPEFATADLARVRDLMAQPILVDGRNLLRPHDAEAAGFTYVAVGRGSVQTVHTGEPSLPHGEA